MTKGPVVISNDRRVMEGIYRKEKPEVWSITEGRSQVPSDRRRQYYKGSIIGMSSSAGVGYNKKGSGNTVVFVCRCVCLDVVRLHRHPYKNLFIQFFTVIL
jgi:hypothetical protein